MADRDRIGRPRGGEGHAWADLEDLPEPVVEEAGETVSVGLVGLGEQPVEDSQLLIPQIAGSFDVEAVLGLDPIDLGADVSPSGSEQAFVGGCREVEASISSEQRHGEVVAGTVARHQYKIYLYFKFRRPRPAAVTGGI